MKQLPGLWTGCEKLNESGCSGDSDIDTRGKVSRDSISVSLLLG